MKYKLKDIDGEFDCHVASKTGQGQYILSINDKELQVEIISMNSKGMDFILDKKYYSVRYLESSTNNMNITVNGIDMELQMHYDLDDVVYKNSGGEGTANQDTNFAQQDTRQDSINQSW